MNDQRSLRWKWRRSELPPIGIEALVDADGSEVLCVEDHGDYGATIRISDADASIIAAAPETKRERDELLAMVKRLEWSAGEGWNAAKCPLCGANRDLGPEHDEGCELAALLARLTVQPVR